jgi:predicted DNA-binding transcriptional regulator AlpA
VARNAKANKLPIQIPDYLIEERVIGISVAAQIADLSEWTLYDLIKRGAGPPIVRLCGRKIGIRVKDLKNWIAQSRA